MPTLTHRLQVLLDEQRYQRLVALADRRDTTVAALVRAALDRTYPRSVAPEEAARRLLDRDARPHLGTWADHKREIESSYERGLRE